MHQNAKTNAKIVYFRKCATIRAITTKHLNEACQEALVLRRLFSSVNAMDADHVKKGWLTNWLTVLGQHDHSTSANRILLSLTLCFCNTLVRVKNVLFSQRCFYFHQTMPVFIQSALVSNFAFASAERAHELGNVVTLWLKFGVTKNSRETTGSSRNRKFDQFTIYSFTNFAIFCTIIWVNSFECSEPFFVFSLNAFWVKERKLWWQSAKGF